MSRIPCTKLAKWSFYCTSARGSSPMMVCAGCRREIDMLLGGLSRRGVHVSVTWTRFDLPRYAATGKPVQRSSCESMGAAG